MNLSKSQPVSAEQIGRPEVDPVVARLAESRIGSLSAGLERIRRAIDANPFLAPAPKAPLSKEARVVPTTEPQIVATADQNGLRENPEFITHNKVGVHQLRSALTSPATNALNATTAPENSLDTASNSAWAGQEQAILDGQTAVRAALADLDASQEAA